MGDHRQATAFWTLEPGRGELRAETLRAPGPDEALVQARHSAISRGTELLVYQGQVPAEIAPIMRAPFQEGDVPGPVKFGYLSVGVVLEGPEHLTGRDVFCLYPHQDRYVVSVAELTPVPDGVPLRRATLVGPVEVGLNALWDGAPRIGDRVAVVGAGMIGGAVAALLRRFPLQRLQLVDVDPARQDLASALGVELVTPDAAADDCDLVVHASASPDGLRRSLELLRPEGEVIEVSWYGTREVAVPLGSVFHPRRLSVRGSQVGEVAAARRVRYTHADRRALALELLRDEAFDALISGSVPFHDLPDVMRRLAAGDLPGLSYVVDY